MINLDGISSLMKGLKNIGFSLFLLLILSGSILTFLNPTAPCEKLVNENSSESVQTAQVQKPIQPIYLEIESNNFAQTLTEVHRLVAVLMLPNRIVPLNYNFRRIQTLRKVINFSSPVSIFIKGHALLN